MKNFSQFIWNLYKNSTEGQKTIDVYEPDRNGHFDLQHHHTRFHWRELNKNNEKFKELRRLLSK